MAGKTVGELQIDLQMNGKSLDASMKNVQKQVGNDADKSATKMGSSMGGFLGSAFTVAAGSLIASGVSTIASGAATLVSGIFEKGFERSNAIENAKSTLTSLGHSAESTSNIMDSALASVKGTAYGLGDAASVAASAVAAGIKPGEELTKTLKTIGDVAAVAKVDFGEMGSIFNKVAANGKVTTQELNQLSDRGVPALDLLSKQLGKTREETQKMVTQGKVDFKTFEEAMSKGMGGAALELGNTWEGALDNIGAAIGRLGQGVAEPLKTALIPILSTVIDVIDEIAPIVADIAKQIAPMIGEFIKKIIPKFGEFAKRILPPMGKLLIALAEAGMAIFEAFEPVLDFILDGIVNFFEFLAQNTEIVQVIFMAVAATSAVLLAINNAIPFIIAGVFLLLTHIGEIWEFIKLVWDWIVGLLATVAGWIYKNVISPIASFFKGLWDGIVAVFSAIGELCVELFEFFSGIAEWVWTNVLQPIVDFVWNCIIAIVAIVASILEAIWNLFAPVAQWIWDNVLQPVINFFVGLWQKIVEIVAGIWQGVVEIVSGIAQWISDNVVMPVVQFFTWLWEQIVGGVTAAIDKVKQVFDVFKNWISQHIVQPIAGFFEKLWEGIKTGVNGIKTIFKNVFSVIVGIVKTPINGIIKGINAVIDMINGMKVPDWVPGIGGMSPNFKKIPELAQGGLVSGRTTAVIGEAGREAVLPLDRNTDNWSGLLASALADEFDARGGGGGGGITIEKQIFDISNEMDADDIGRKVMNSLRRAA